MDTIIAFHHYWRLSLMLWYLNNLSSALNDRCYARLYGHSHSDITANKNISDAGVPGVSLNARIWVMPRPKSFWWMFRDRYIYLQGCVRRDPYKRGGSTVYRVVDRELLWSPRSVSDSVKPRRGIVFSVADNPRQPSLHDFFLADLWSIHVSEMF